MSAHKPSPLLGSTYGLKLIMAVTGVALFAFVLQHMIGNWTVYAGRDAFNEYAAFMQSLKIKWPARITLLAFLGLHVWSAVKLTARNTSARPQRYAGLKSQTSTVYGRSMILSGWVVLAYLAYHLAHFTGEVVNYDQLFDELGRRDVYTNFVRSFSNPVIALTYIVANVAIALHLAHAMSSFFRTLGLASGRLKAPLAKVGPAFGVLIGVGNISMPLACLLGVVSV